MPDKRKKYSLATIAAELGVSKSAVSFVLNGTARKRRISPELEKRIREFCARVNYLPNIHAQRMNSVQVKNIGILLNENSAPFENNPFKDYNVANIVGGIADAAAAHGDHPAVTCLKWAVQRGQIPIPFSVKQAQYVNNLKAAFIDPLTDDEMAAIAADDRNCRLVKGQVFLWPGATDWQDLWDINGTITGQG